MTKKKSKSRKTFTTTNEHIQRDVFAHRTHLIRAENGFVSQLLVILDAAFREFYHAFTVEYSPIRLRGQFRLPVRLNEAVGKKLSSTVASDYANQVTQKLEVVLKSTLTQVESAIRTAVVDTSLAETEVLADILNARVPNEVLDLAHVLVRSQLTDEEYRAITTRPDLSRAVEGRYNQFLERTQEILQKGFEDGISAKNIASQIRGTYDASLRRGVAQLARSEMESVAMDTMAAMSENNPELVSQEQWMSAFDSKICVVCMNLDGEVFEVRQGPYPIRDTHLNCRCMRIPVLASFADLGLEIDELPEMSRASMNGAVPGRLTYREFFEDQDEEFQREVLGNTRFDMWQSGGINLDDLSIGTRIRSIRELVSLNSRRLSR